MDQAPRNYTQAMAALKAAVPTMEDRPQQDTAARAIEQAIEHETILVCQAGTGVGKSNAALIPSIVSGKRVVYATATKVLQSQIVEKDLPFLQEHLGIDFTFASLKGWSSYVCHSKLSQHEDTGLRDALLAELEADPDHVGDRESFATDFTPSEWSALSISTEDCPGRKSCPFGTVCKPQSARDKIVDADVAVVNHSILATDALVQGLTDGGFTLVGQRDVVIVDEAHELEEFISGVLGEQFTEGSIRNLIAESRAFARRVGVEVDEALRAFSEASATFFHHLQVGRLRYADVVVDSGPFEALLSAYIGLRDALTGEGVLAAIAKIAEPEKAKLRAQRERMLKQVGNKVAALAAILLQDDTDLVRYVEQTVRTYNGIRTTTKALKTTPVSVAPWAEANLWPLYDTAVLISATVLVDGSSDFVSSRFGLGQHTAMDAGTPFDYHTNARLYVPAHLPEPTPKDRARWSILMLDEIKELVTASGGGALLLFTSNTQLNDAWSALEHRLPFECRRQGGAESNNRLMEWFRAERNGVLFATRSFFTGASFEGDTCRLVIIDKLPFPVPTDPVFEARSEQIKQRGGSDFNELSIPMMTLPLQQGFGRLIRTKSDQGVVAILDPRLKTKGYGSKIVRSLPPAKMVTSFADVEAFFSQIHAATIA